jgi:hypothetical protein
VVVAFEDETTITQKPQIRESMSFEGEQQKIACTGNRKKFSVYISMVLPDEKLMTYDFYDKMNSTNTITHLEKLKINNHENGLLEKIDTDNASYHKPDGEDYAFG